MRPIGRPQFTDPAAATAHAVLSSATGTAAELAAMRKLAEGADAEARDQIGNLIEAFIVKFGFPGDD
jgi:hypothetical protein